MGRKSNRGASRRIATICLLLLLIPMTTAQCRGRSCDSSGARLAAVLFVQLAVPRALAAIGRFLIVTSPKAETHAQKQETPCTQDNG